MDLLTVNRSPKDVQLGLDFNSNGTKMFVVGTVENKIFEFDFDHWF